VTLPHLCIIESAKSLGEAILRATSDNSKSEHSKYPRKPTVMCVESHTEGLLDSVVWAVASVP
jgi:hypothetical protein